MPALQASDAAMPIAWMPAHGRSCLPICAAREPDTAFLGDAIGAPFSDLLALEPAGFDLLFNSACWWDFKAPWALDQYDQLRRFTRTVTFPESPYGPRLVDALGRLEPGRLEAAYRSRYLFAASFSAGVLMPMGFEFAATGTTCRATGRRCARPLPSICRAMSAR
jgi:starch synthase (maltosyl-transferring)